MIPGIIDIEQTEFSSWKCNIHKNISMLKATNLYLILILSLFNNIAMSQTNQINFYFAEYHRIIMQNLNILIKHKALLRGRLDEALTFI